jgi:hypothetical protein
MAIGINGLGRIGRLALRAALGGVLRDPSDTRQGSTLNIVHVNERKGGAATAAHLLEFDSIHGRWRGQLGAMMARMPSALARTASASLRRPCRVMCRGAILAVTSCWNAPENSSPPRRCRAISTVG